MNNPFAVLGGQDSGFAQMIQQLRQFQQNFRGDPKAEVERLLQSGAMTQGQLDQLQSMARQIQSLMQ